MLKRTLMSGVAGLALAVVAAAPASAAVSYNFDSNSGSVGAGDVKSAFGWTNTQLNTNAEAVDFTDETTVVQLYTWQCERTWISPTSGESHYKVIDKSMYYTINSVNDLTETVTYANKNAKVKQVAGFSLADGTTTTAPAYPDDADHYPGKCPSGYALDEESDGVGKGLGQGGPFTLKDQNVTLTTTTTDTLYAAYGDQKVALATQSTTEDPITMSICSVALPDGATDYLPATVRTWPLGSQFPEQNYCEGETVVWTNPNPPLEIPAPATAPTA